MEIGKIDDRRMFVLHPETGKQILEAVKEHPDYPIAVLVSQDDNFDDYSWVYALSVSVETGEILDCFSEWTDDEIVDADRDYFVERVEDAAWRRLIESLGRDPTDEELDACVNAVLKAHEPYWKKCITIKACA